MKQHIHKVVATCFLHLRHLWQIRRRVGQEVTCSCSWPMSSLNTWLDYCNSILAGLPCSTLESPQRVQNVAAQLVFQLSSRDHITPSLLQLHCNITHCVYFIMTELHHVLPTGNLWAAEHCNLVFALKTHRATMCHKSAPTFVQTLFFVGRPVVWNRLLVDIRSEQDVTRLKNSRKG